MEALSATPARHVLFVPGHVLFAVREMQVQEEEEMMVVQKWGELVNGVVLTHVRVARDGPDGDIDWDQVFDGPVEGST